MSEEQTERKHHSFLKALGYALLGAFTLLIVTGAFGYFAYIKWIKPELDKLPFGVQDFQEAYKQYEEIKIFMEQYEEEYQMYLEARDWEKLDELNRKKDELSTDMQQMEEIMKLLEENGDSLEIFMDYAEKL